MPAEKRYTQAGTALYHCEKHHRAVSMSWGKGYPPAEAPVCLDEGVHKMKLAGGDNPADNLEDVPQEPEPAA